MKLALWSMILDQDESNHDANSNVFQIIRPFYTGPILQLLLTVVDKELNGTITALWAMSLLQTPIPLVRFCGYLLGLSVLKTLLGQAAINIRRCCYPNNMDIEKL